MREFPEEWKQKWKHGIGCFHFVSTDKSLAAKDMHSKWKLETENVRAPLVPPRHRHVNVPAWGWGYRRVQQNDNCFHSCRFNSLRFRVDALFAETRNISRLNVM